MIFVATYGSRRTIANYYCSPKNKTGKSILRFSKDVSGFSHHPERIARPTVPVQRRRLHVEKKRDLRLTYRSPTFLVKG
jgi:hypothetical protein